MNTISWTEFKAKVNQMRARDICMERSKEITADGEPVAMFIIPPTQFARADIQAIIDDQEQLTGKGR